MVPVAAGFAALAGARPVGACSCLASSVESSFQQSSDVLSLTVVASLGAGSERWSLARVSKAYKGCREPGALVVLSSAGSSAACGVALPAGVPYLVQGHATGSVLGLPRLQISLCDYNLPLAELSEHDRQFLDTRDLCCGAACVCADGSQPVQCFASPCAVTQACAEAVSCVDNYCGGCDAELYDAQGNAACLPGGCDSDADCPADEWCRQAPPDRRAPEASGSGSALPRECVPFVNENQACGGFRPAWTFERCAPPLICDVPDFIADATGICRQPCSSDAECPSEQYCASDGVCDLDGRCEQNPDCELPGNDYSHPDCAGHGECPDFQTRCSWICDGAAAECRSDADCAPTGCSGQICAAESRVTTCEFREEYACYQDRAITTCGCRGGQCAWDATEALTQCLAEAALPSGE
jgi:eight-cysteine-cluster-containing protein